MGFPRRAAIAVFHAVLVGSGFAFAQTDLGRRYPATLEFRENSEGYEWTSTPQDVWRLKEFTYTLGDTFAIRLGPSQVVLGCHEGNVLWAAVFPDAPGQIVSAPSGQGEHATSLWLRFHPARLGELFPEGNVTGQGDASLLASARRLAGHRIRGCWQAGGRPVIPWKKSITFDLETQEGPRRFYSLDTETGGVHYVDAFRERSLPKPRPLDSATALAAFDKAWEAFDAEYAMFAIKPGVDWPRLRETYRPRAAEARSNQELGAIIAEMLAHLEDLHVHVEVDGEAMPGYTRSRPLNANPRAIDGRVGPIIATGHDLDWGRTADGIGYINIHGLSDPALPETFDKALAAMADTKGLIVDLRFNGGGSELLGCQVAGRLLDRRRVYSLSQYRSGPDHADLGPTSPRACGPAGPWHYAGPVVVLQGQKTISSAESFALALAQCPQVTTLGDRTAGSSGNPRRVDAGAGIVASLPRWIDRTPDGTPIDGVGIAPRVKIETRPEDFQGDRDPVLAAALENLRSRPESEAAPADGVLQRRAP